MFAIGSSHSLIIKMLITLLFFGIVQFSFQQPPVPNDFTIYSDEYIATAVWNTPYLPNNGPEDVTGYSLLQLKKTTDTTLHGERTVLEIPLS